MAIASDVRALAPSTPNEWCVDGVVSGLTLLWGDPGRGKSFVAVSMAVSVATGRPWIGRQTKEGRVVYVAGEGGAEAIFYRTRAAALEWGVDLYDPSDEPVPITIVTPGVNLTAGPEELVGLIGEGGQPAPVLVVVDTLSRCFVGDENKQEFMGAFVRTLDYLRHIYGCDIVVIHHGTKPTDTRVTTARGSSVLVGAADVVWHLSGMAGSENRGERILIAEKLRERDASEAEIRLRLESRTVCDADGPILNLLGGPQTSLVVKPTRDHLADATRLKLAADSLLAGVPTTTYTDMLLTSGLSKARFEAALSLMLTQPGEWGLEHVGAGVYRRVSL